MKVLREKQVLERIPVVHSTLWEWVNDGLFPAPQKLSKRVTVWNEADVDAWLEAKFKGDG